jgi:hypothetical protein
MTAADKMTDHYLTQPFRLWPHKFLRQSYDRSKHFVLTNSRDGCVTTLIGK